MALARRKLVSKNCPECGYALQERHSPFRYMVISSVFALCILIAARMCSPDSNNTGSAIPTRPFTPGLPPPVASKPSGETNPIPQRTTPGGKETKAPTDLFRRAEELADEVKFTKGLSAPALAKALARKGTPHEITDPELLAAVVYRWVATNIDYDVASLNPTSRSPQNPDFILKDRKGVCEGYSCLCDFLLSQNQVESRIVHGLARTEPPGGRSLTRDDDGHAWIIVKWGAMWHLIEPTWGAGSVNRNQFEDSFKWDWFDVRPEVAIYTHIPEDDWMRLMEDQIPVGQIEKSARLAPLFFDALDIDPLPLVPGTLVLNAQTPTLSWKVSKGYSVLLNAAPTESPVELAKAANEFTLPSGVSVFSFPHLPHGDYVLDVFARRPGSTEHVFCGSFSLRQSASDSPKQPPVTFKKYKDLDAQLIEPLEGRLVSGTWRRFAIQAKPGLSLALQLEGETTMNYLSETSRVHEGRILLRKGKLRLWQVSGKEMYPLLEFTVE